MRPDLVIFDCDGVLVDSEPITDAVIAANLTRYGLPIAPAQSHALFVGGTMAGAAQEATRRGARLPENWIDEIYAEIFAALSHGVPVIEGVVALLDLLDAQGVPIAIASNGPRRKMEISLTPSGLWDRFAPHIYSAHDDNHPKPDPHMIFKAMSAAGARAAQTVFVDDSPTGIAAGVAAGVRCYGFDPTGTRRYGPAVAPLRAMAQLAEVMASSAQTRLGQAGASGGDI